MKKLLSLGLVAAMAMSAMPMAYATHDVSNGTEVEYLGSKTTLDGEGNEVYAESYTVTVPAKMAPGGSAFVKAEGTWNSARKLVVTADENVVLENNINTNDTKTLDVTFNGINLVGDNNVAVANYGDGVEGEAIAVGNIENALFGTWEGVFEYNVEIVDNVELITFTTNIYVYTSDDDGDYIDRTYQAEAGMTWGEWVNSKYNVDGFRTQYDDYDDVTHISCPLGDGIGVLGEKHPDRETGGNYWFVYAEDEIIANKKYNGIN